MENAELMSKIESLNEGQRKQIEDEVLSLLVDDSETKNALTQLKHDVYKLYSSDIAKLVADVEVHFHDLPVFVYGLVETIFRITAIAINEEDESKAESYYQEVIKYEKFTISYVQIQLLEHYLKEIKNYRKTMTKFNHKGVLTDSGTPGMKDIIYALNASQKEYRYCKKIFKKCYTFDQMNGASSIKIKTDQIVDNVIESLQRCYTQVTQCLKLCETYYPPIIGNGHIESFGRRCLHVLFNLFSDWLMKMKLKKANTQNIYTAKELAKNAVQKHEIVTPFYTKKQAYRFIAEVRGTIFGHKAKRKDIIDF